MSDEREPGILEELTRVGPRGATADFLEGGLPQRCRYMHMVLCVTLVGVRCLGEKS
jgi:hypothetical protein